MSASTTEEHLKRQKRRNENMSISRKHFIAIAAALKESNASVEVIDSVAAALSCFNAQFNTSRFIVAATGDGSD